MDTDEWVQINEEICCILAHKSSGEVHTQVESAGDENGVEALRRIDKFMTQISGQGVMQRQQKVLYPEPCVNEMELAGELERWQEDMGILNKHTESVIPDHQLSVILRN